VSSFDKAEGVKISPSRHDFIRWMKRTITEIKEAFLGGKKLIGDDLIIDIDPEYRFESSNPYDILDRFIPLKTAAKVAYETVNDSFSFFDSELQHHTSFMRQLIEQSDEASHFVDVREVEKLQQTIQHLLKAKESLARRPKNIFHEVHNQEEETDFVIDMRPTIEAAGNYLEQGTIIVRSRIVNNLNNSLFTEIQEKWVSISNKRMSAVDCRYIETRMVLYAVMSHSVCEAWPEAIHDLKASFDTVMRMYRQLNQDCKYTHTDAIMAFNAAADVLGISQVHIRNDEYDYDEEDKEEEGNVREAVANLSDDLHLVEDAPDE
jgi:hypothetical protein